MRISRKNRDGVTHVLFDARRVPLPHIVWADDESGEIELLDFSKQVTANGVPYWPWDAIAANGGDVPTIHKRGIVEFVRAEPL